jgi:hypothetical protein
MYRSNRPSQDGRQIKSDMKKVELKKVLMGLTVASIIGLAACNGRASQSSASSREMKIENVNEAAGSFDMVDVRTKKVLSYDRITINSQQVVSTKCMSMMGAGYVIFNYDRISDAGKEIANVGIRADAPHGYELAEGILNILVDNPPAASDNTAVRKEEKPAVRFKGGTCVYKSTDYSAQEERLSLTLHYTLDDNADTGALAALDEGVIESSEGKTYQVKKSFSNSEYSLYRLDYHFPDAIRQGMSFKYVLDGQEIPIPFGN